MLTKRTTGKRFLQAVLTGLLLVLAAGCGMEKEVLLSGRTMGTFYHIKVVAGYFEDLSGLQAKIDARLEEINQSMSTYRPDSEISRFNQLPANETMAVSADFLDVLKAAKKVYALSGGAWDGTVKPLVNLWGFGNTRPVRKAPPQAEIQANLKNVGFSQIRILKSGRVGKRNPAITLDLASIAKGFGVDAVADLIRKSGYGKFLVEIGGEVVAAGVRKDGKPWVVGISRPSPEASPGSVYRAIAISQGALATSGDYRIFFELDGVRYSHVIDPRTGYPVSNQVVSVSILAPDCMFADGLATAVMVLGADKGKALIDRLESVEGLIIVKNKDGSLAEFPSNGFYNRLPKSG
jgi:FAD:protein FMN transferase